MEMSRSWLTRVRRLFSLSPFLPFSLSSSGFRRSRLLLEWLEERTVLSTFTNVTGAALPSIPGVELSSVAWGDANNDGRLDFLLTGLNDNSGLAVTQLWQNNGNGTFTNATSTAFPGGAPPGVYDSSVAWGDYNNDGYLDFLLTGLNNSGLAVTQLWQNNGNGTFTNVTSTAFPGGAPPGVYDSSVAWADANNDGKLGFLLTGLNNSGTAITQLWQNNGNGTFTNATSTAFPGGAPPGVYDSSVAWADANNDGSLDFLLTGLNNSGTAVTQLWQNNGNGTFTNATGTAFPGGAPPGVYQASVAWGDDNNDGQLDFLLAGESNSGIAVTQLWQNSGQGTFINATSAAFPGGAPPGVSLSSVVWGDYNNDGQLDFLLAGFTNASTNITQLWQNSGNDTFSNVTAAAFPGIQGVIGSSLAWGDYNNDGQLDFLLTGEAGTSLTQLWQNGEGTADVAPSAPTHLQAAVSDSSVTLSWQAPAASGSTPPEGLSYDLRVGTTPGGGDVLSALALPNGTLLDPENNTLVHGLSYTLQGLTLGQTYYWSVQAVDNAFNGSPFAAGASFVTGGALSVTLNPSSDTVTAGQPATFTAAASGNPNPTVQWEVSTDNGASYNAVPGATSDTLTFTTVANNNGNLYEAVFNNAQGSATTTAATLTVLFAPSVTANPSNDTVTAGQPATFKAATSGNPNPLVQWDVSTNGGISYHPVSGATSDTLTFTTAANQNGNLYEAVFMNAQGSATTTPATLAVLLAPTVTSNPSNDTVTAGQPATFTAAASGNPNLTVQWDVSTDNGASYNAVPGATSDTLTFTTTANQNGNRYEAIFTNAQGSATTTAATLTVLFAPTITSSPSSDTVSTDQPVTFTAAASGNPNPTVQWEVSTDNGVSYNLVPGATSDTLTFTTAANQNGNRYEAVFNNAVGNATTTAASLTMLFAPTITSNPSRFCLTICDAGVYPSWRPTRRRRN
jgi:FG-GAP-like repeat/Immunoglobulin I-set domain/Fibronectin type III domain